MLHSDYSVVITLSHCTMDHNRFLIHQVLLLLSKGRELLFFINSWPRDCFLLASDFFLSFFFLCSLIRLWFSKVFVFAGLSVGGICCWSFFFDLIFDFFHSTSLDSGLDPAELDIFADCTMLLRFNSKCLGFYCRVRQCHLTKCVDLHNRKSLVCPMIVMFDS